MSVGDFKPWLEQAEHDVDSANLLLRENGHADMIIFHTHQAVEKTLKGLLIKHGMAVPETHDLDPLLLSVRKHYPKLDSVQRRIAALDLFSPTLRYPTGDKLTRQQALECWDMMQEILNVLQ